MKDLGADQKEINRYQHAPKKARDRFGVDIRVGTLDVKWSNWSKKKGKNMPPEIEKMAKFIYKNIRIYSPEQGAWVKIEKKVGYATMWKWIKSNGRLTIEEAMNRTQPTLSITDVYRFTDKPFSKEGYRYRPKEYPEYKLLKAKTHRGLIRLIKEMEVSNAKNS